MSSLGNKIMWIVCQCGNKTATQPWKSSKQVMVTKCLKCQPGRLDRKFEYKPESKADQIRALKAKR